MTFSHICFKRILTDIRFYKTRIFNSIRNFKISIFGSSFFTALNDGLVSAAISFLRTLVFQVAAVLLLPGILGVDGIWISVTAAEILSVGVTIAFLKGKQKRYEY